MQEKLIYEKEWLEKSDWVISVRSSDRRGKSRTDKEIFPGSIWYFAG